jgi:hypothetical protein
VARRFRPVLRAPIGGNARQERADQAASGRASDRRHRGLSFRAARRSRRHALVRFDGGLPAAVRYAQTLAAFERDSRRTPPKSPLDDLRLRGDSQGIPFGNGAPDLCVDIPTDQLAAREEGPRRRQGFQDRRA